MKKIKKKTIWFLLISIIAITPIFLLSACVSKKDDGDEKIELRDELLKKIKADINNTFFNEEVLAIDQPFFEPITTDNLFKILETEKAKLGTNPLNNIDISSSEIISSFIKNTNLKLQDLNRQLKSDHIELENVNKNIVEIQNSKLILENINFEDLSKIHKQIVDNKTNDIFISYLRSGQNQAKVYKVILKLELNINITDQITSAYSLQDLDYYITTNKNDINTILSEMGDEIVKILKNKKINLDQLVDVNDNDYVLSGSKLEKKLISLISSEFLLPDNISLQINKINFANDNIRFELRSLKHSTDQGTYYKKFLTQILESDLSIIDELLTNNKTLKELNANELHSDFLNIKKFKYTPLSWKIDNIAIPPREIDTYININKERFKQYLKEFRKFFKAYFELSNAGKIDDIGNGELKKVMKIDYNSLWPDTWSNGPVKALLNYYNNVLKPKINDENKKYFKMEFSHYGQPRYLDKDNKCFSFHWDSTLELIFKFKIFEIKFLDSEGIKFINVCKNS